MNVNQAQLIHDISAMLIANTNTIGEETRTHLENAIRSVINNTGNAMEDKIRSIYTTEGRLPAVVYYRRNVDTKCGLRDTVERVDSICKGLTQGGLYKNVER